MARANIFTAAARWIRGAISGQERRNPWTGDREIRQSVLRGKWFSAAGTPDPAPRALNPGQHPKPQRAVAGMASRAIGTGRIGVGERIGTGLGTATASGSATAGRAGPGGVIGMRIGVGPDEGRGAASGGSGSGS